MREVGAELDLGQPGNRPSDMYEAAYVQMGKPKKPEGLAGDAPAHPPIPNVMTSWQKVMVEARDDQWVIVRVAGPICRAVASTGSTLINDDLPRPRQRGPARTGNRLDLMNSRGQVWMPGGSWQFTPMRCLALLPSIPTKRCDAARHGSAAQYRRACKFPPADP